MSKFRFSYLLGTLLLLILTIAVTSAAGRHPATQLAVSAVFVAMLVVGAFASSGSARTRRTILVLAGLMALLRIWLEFSANATLEAATYAVGLTTLFTVAVLTIKNLLASTRVTTDTLAASLCGYGFLVAAWAAAYSLLEVLQPGSFIYPDIASLERQMRFGLGDSATALYFSFVTMTTLGYGDIVPATDSSRLLAAMQAFMGQAYIAILVAKLVGQYVVAATASGDKD